MNERSPIIVVENLVKKFGDFTANDNLNFKVYEGEIFGFLGANGAGKTTAIRILLTNMIPNKNPPPQIGVNKYL